MKSTVAEPKYRIASIRKALWNSATVIRSPTGHPGPGRVGAYRGCTTASIRSDDVACSRKVASWGRGKRIANSLQVGGCQNNSELIQKNDV